MINKSALYIATENKNHEIAKLLLSCKRHDVNQISILNDSFHQIYKSLFISFYMHYFNIILFTII